MISIEPSATRTISIATLVLAACFAHASPDLAQPRPPVLCGGEDCPQNAQGDFHPAEYTLVFEDEFAGNELDRTRWCTRYIYGGGAKPQIIDEECQYPGEGTADHLNDEKQRYVDFNMSGARMHVVSSGILNLRATKTGASEEAPYEAGMIRSKRTFFATADTSYYFTTRVDLPNVRGTWPSFWLNSDRKPDGTTGWPPEIDIFEGALNEQEDTEFMLRMGSQIRSTGQTDSGRREVTFSAPGFNLRWNTYKAPYSLRDRWIEVGAEWTHRGVCYFVNGLKVMCENYRWAYEGGLQAAPAHMLLNLAIGGSWAGRHGIADEKFPTELRIDYVRVYAKQVR
jgi:beta-glucanase (GH16 family)